MEYRRTPYQRCSGCYDRDMALNEYGMCAKCFSKLSPERIMAMTGTPVVERTVTVIKPSPGRKGICFWGFMGGLWGAMAYKAMDVFFFR